jgi:Protein of unknown function (DUF3443)
VPRLLFSALLVSAIWTLGCGGSSNNTTMSGNNPIAGPAGNVVSITAGGGPSNPAGLANGAFTSVTVCAPGSANCATIGGVLVDTGSTGLRILSSVLPSGFSLPKQTDSGGSPIVECLQFGDGFTWGPVEMADMKISGEQASSLPIQVIGDPNFSAVPASCSSAALGPNENTVALLGANGILGVGNFRQDCGSACTVSGPSNPGVYFSCPASGCVVTTEALNLQVQHPVMLFATDNNGVIVELPAVPSSGAVTESGSLVFGIGTQSNNALSGTTVLTLDSSGNFTTVFNTQSVPGFVDAGSNGLFFLDSATTGLATCALGSSTFYCPASTQNFAATNRGVNGQSTPVSFSVANASLLLSSSNPNFLFNNLAAPNPPNGNFDWGLPFFFGRNVFIAIEGQSTPGGSGPYTAY